jgi:hypothetical protein
LPWWRQAVGTLKTGTSGANGAKVSVGCLLSVEVSREYKMLRVSLRSTIPSATAKLFDAIKRVLLG